MTMWTDAIATSSWYPSNCPKFPALMTKSQEKKCRIVLKYRPCEQWSEKSGSF